MKITINTKQDKIIIKKNPNGDTRTAPKGITFEQFAAANDSHNQLLDPKYNILKTEHQLWQPK